MNVNLKPGSLTADGVVVGIFPVRDPWQEPVVVPTGFGASLRRTIARARLLEQAGWVVCPAALHPRILNRGQLALIHKDSAAYRLFLRTPAHRRRHGAARP